MDDWLTVRLLLEWSKDRRLRSRPVCMWSKGVWTPTRTNCASGCSWWFAANGGSAGAAWGARFTGA